VYTDPGSDHRRIFKYRVNEMQAWTFEQGHGVGGQQVLVIPGAEITRGGAAVVLGFSS
jgi:hypothetical protein